VAVAERLVLAEFSSIAGVLGEDAAALGVALAEVEEYHNRATWKVNAGNFRIFKRRAQKWTYFHLIGYSTDIGCVSGLNAWILKSFVDKAFMFCFLLVVQGEATIAGNQVYPGFYMLLKSHGQVFEVSGGELLTVVLHFLPAACGGNDAMHRGAYKVAGGDDCQRQRKAGLLEDS
jgi:hypothetical protein